MAENKPAWQTVLNSSSVTALITTLIGGLFASYITVRYQDKAKEVDRARAETQDSLERERKVVEDMFTISGRLIAASENMIWLTSTEFDERNKTPADLDRLRGVKKGIIKDYNDADWDWHSHLPALTLRIRMEHRADQGVSDAWKSASAALTAYSDCSHGWWREHPEPVDLNKLETACALKKEQMQKSLDGLTAEILRFRQQSSETPRP